MPLPAVIAILLAVSFLVLVTIRAESKSRRLQRIIDTHELCHNASGEVDARAFADGCTAYQRQLFGCAPDADEIERLRNALQAKTRRVEWD